MLVGKDRKEQASKLKEELEEANAVIKRLSDQHIEFMQKVNKTLLTLSDSLCCPILHIPFTDPVVLDDGHTYEKRIIEQCLASNGKRSPLTNLPVQGNLIPNYTMRELMEDDNLLQAVKSLEEEIDKCDKEKRIPTESLPAWANARIKNPRVLVIVKSSHVINKFEYPTVIQNEISG